MPSLKTYRPTRNLKKRVELWWLLFNILVLSDEVLKEGYLVSFTDFTKPLTHENILVLGNMFFLGLYMYMRKRGGR